MIQNASRREFLRTASVVASSVGTAAAPFALNLATLGAASAQTGDYKAIVCVFLYGGNDSSNMVLRTDSESFDRYTQMRTSIALLAPGTPVNRSASLATPARLGGVSAITPQFTENTLGRSDNLGKTFAVHPSMGAVADLFAAGRLGILSNAGPLIRPTRPEDVGKPGFLIPWALASHNDQQSTWQALGPEGARVGWGGRLGDLMATRNSKTIFTSISLFGNAVFSQGDTTIRYPVSAGGYTPSINGLSAEDGRLYGSRAAVTNLRASITANSQNLFANEYAAITKRAIESRDLFQSAYNQQAGGVAAPTPYRQPSTETDEGNNLAIQLQTVATIIAARGALGVNRQVFFVGLNGFDTHSSQNPAQADLLARLSHAIGYFDNALATLPGGDMRNQVTLFTASDFGRTISSNGNGTDHGWGAAHFVHGGAVAGGDIYGRFPMFGRSPEDSNGGSFVPSISVDQIGSTLGRWFGASDSSLDLVFPNLRNFNNRDLGFMRST